MKKMSIFKIMAVLITATLLIWSCTKENEDVRLDPTLSTSQVNDVTSNSATVYGFVVAAGGGFSEKGVCFSNEPTPTTDNNKVVYEGDKSLAAYPVKLTGLNFATKYYVRAYAINAAGTMYGEEFSFTTLPVIPTVTTTAVTAVTASTATTGGNVTADGGAEVTARGVVYGLEENPVVDSLILTNDGTGIGEFTSSLAGLSDLTKYYVRAYAINSAGVAYGEQLEFTTEEIIILARTWYVPGDYVAASYPGYTYNDWDPANSPQVRSTDATPDNVEGYVYMANASNQWKIATKPNWDGPNYGGGDGILSETGGNITATAGYYKININAAALTYTAVATNWGVIGNATPLEWTDETPLVYEPALRTWTGGMHIVPGNFKFRANHSWDHNYGGSAGVLTFGGADIPVEVEADYYFVLDLSNPLAYTYSANHWGLIGNATPGGWDSDQNMTWDAANHCMTITVDLTAGSMKFRANDAWDINLGGDINALTQGGADIAVTEAGNYTIKLFLAGAGGHCTIVKN